MLPLLSRGIRGLGTDGERVRSQTVGRQEEPLLQKKECFCPRALELMTDTINRPQFT